MTTLVKKRSSSRSSKLEIRLHSGQVPIVESDVWCTAAIAGTGGGKTVVGYPWLIKEMQRRPGMLHLVAEPTLDMVQRVLLTATPGRPDLITFLRWFDKSAVYLRSKRLLHHRLGTVALVSAENPDAWQGAHIGSCWLDECGLMSRLAWITAVQRVAYASGRILATSTPYNMGWLKTDIYDPYHAGNTDIVVSQFPSTSNPHYDPAVIERARGLMSAERGRMMFDGQFGRPEGMIYDCYDDEFVLVDDFVPPSTWQHFGGLDFGFNHPFAGLAAARNPDGVYFLYWEYKRSERTIGHHSVAIKASGPAAGARWYCDPSGAQFILELQGLGISATGGNNDVAAGIDKVYELMAGGRLKICRSLHHVRDEIEGYEWQREKDDTGFSDDPVKLNDDLVDALRYMLMGAERTGPQLFI